MKTLRLAGLVLLLATACFAQEKHHHFNDIRYKTAEIVYTAQQDTTSEINLVATFSYNVEGEFEKVDVIADGSQKCYPTAEFKAVGNKLNLKITGCALKKRDWLNIDLTRKALVLLDIQ